RHLSGRKPPGVHRPLPHRPGAGLYPRPLLRDSGRCEGARPLHPEAPDDAHLRGTPERADDRSGAPGHPAQDSRPGFAGGRKEIPMKRDLRGLYLLLVLLAASFAFGKFQGGFVPWFLFYVTLFLTLYAAAVALGALRKVEVARELSPKRLTAGETLHVTIRYRILSHFPLSWLYFREKSDLKHPRQGHLVFGWRNAGEINYSLSRIPRG